MEGPNPYEMFDNYDPSQVMLNKYKNKCIGGVTDEVKKSWSKKRYLAEFSKGPCYPYIYTPGVLST